MNKYYFDFEGLHDGPGGFSGKVCVLAQTLGEATQEGMQTVIKECLKRGIEKGVLVAMELTKIEPAATATPVAKAIRTSEAFRYN